MERKQVDQIRISKAVGRKMILRSTTVQLRALFVCFFYSLIFLPQFLSAPHSISFKYVALSRDDRIAGRRSCLIWLESLSPEETYGYDTAELTSRAMFSA